jgi:hypothetical protein
VSSDTNELEDEDEDTVENSTFITPLSRNDLTPRKSRSNLKLKSLAPEARSSPPTLRIDLKSRASCTNLKPKHPNADLKAQLPRGEVGTAQPPTISSRTVRWWLDFDSLHGVRNVQRCWIVDKLCFKVSPLCKRFSRVPLTIPWKDHAFVLPQPALPPLDLNKILVNLAHQTVLVCLPIRAESNGKSAGESELEVGPLPAFNLALHNTPGPLWRAGGRATGSAECK